jgi:hypothetical protein
MKRKLSPFEIALALVLGCVVLRLLNGLFPHVIPNVSPLLALAYVGAMVLPRRWGWLVAPAALVVTEIAFVSVDQRVTGTMFPWWGLLSLPFYLAASALGLLIAKNKSLVKILAGSIALSVAFYLVANTFCWAGSAFTHSVPGYPPTLAGWWQANTVGLPGYVPTWTFLRNGVAGDLFFVLVLLLVLDRALILGHAPVKPAPARSA